MGPTERRRSIRLRLALATAALVAGVAAVVLAGLYWVTGELLERRVDSELEGELDELARRHAQAGGDWLAREVEQRGAEPGAEHVYVYAETQLTKIAGNLDAWPRGLDADGEAQPFTWQQRSLRIERRARVATRVLDDGRRLLVGRDVTGQRGYQRTLGLSALSAFGLALVLALAGGQTISRNLLARVEKMNRTVLRILGGHKGERVPVAALPDEFDELAAHFNRLLDENDRLVARMREVTDDVAHDLRTPLSRMRAHIESALAHPGDPGAEREALHRLLSETEAVLDTFNGLLRISQIEAGTIRSHMEALELAPLVEDAVELYQPLAEEAGIALERDVAPGLAIRGDRHLLSQALVNLLDNALKYGGAGPVTVAACGRDGRVDLSVGDRGTGIAPEDRERVLQRFTRLEAARNRPGTGLGLSFVAAVAELHGAELRLEDNGPGLRVTFSFQA